MTVPPVFWKKIAYFYTTDTDYSADLRVYEYTSNIKAPRLLHTEAMTSETSQRYQEYTMVSVGEFGVIFKVQGGTTWTRYVWNENTQSLDSFSPSFTDPGGLGTLTDASMTIIQVREDPENYVEGEYPPLYLVDTGNNDYLIKVVFADATETITVDSSVAIPAEYKIEMKLEHVDVGRQHFVVMSPIDCSADETTGSVVTKPSVRTYTFGTAAWACDDVEISDPSSNAWALDGTRRRLTGIDEYEDILNTKQHPLYDEI